MGELEEQAKAHRDGLATAFDPLREQLERLKSDFWGKNGEVIKANARKYVERKVKEMVAVEASFTSSRPTGPRN